jgi:hypothetical protein
MTRPSGETAARAALERFVVENEDLLALEERIGRFNIFDALGVVRAEIRHSNFLAWLLDPLESHGQGALFLKALLMDLLRHTPPTLRPLSPVELDGVQPRGVEIRREWRHVDILIRCDEPQFVIAIENKSASDVVEKAAKLNRYEEEVARAFPGWRTGFVYLTPDGGEASRERWTTYTYRDIHRVLERCRGTNAGAIGDDVALALGHYLRMIGSRFMDDSSIDELCKRIYTNHRQALELIFEHGKRDAFEEGAASAIEKWGKAEVLASQASGVWFLPLDIADRVPGNAVAWKHLSRPVSVVCRLQRGKKKSRVRLIFEMTAMTDPALKNRVFKALSQRGFKFSNQAADPDARYSRFYRLVREADLDDPQAVDAAGAALLTEAEGNGAFRRLSDACRAVFP